MKKQKQPFSRRELHQAYWLFMGWALFFGAMGFNALATYQHNTMAAQVSAQADRTALDGMMNMASAQIELLPPPVEARQ